MDVTQQEGQPSTVVGNFDMSVAGDRSLVRRSIVDGKQGKRRRWGGITDDLKEKLVKACEAALVQSANAGDVRDITNLAKVLVAMEGQNQADDHLDDKNERLDGGKATEITVVTVPPPVRARLE